MPSREEVHLLNLRGSGSDDDDECVLKYGAFFLRWLRLCVVTVFSDGRGVETGERKMQRYVVFARFGVEPGLTR